MERDIESILLSEEQIQAMYEFDLQAFRSDNRFKAHSFPLDIDPVAVRVAKENCESNGVKVNCYVSNLEWATYSENTKHAYGMGL